MNTAEQTQTDFPDSPVEAAIIQDMREVGIMPRREATVMELATVIAGSRDFPDCRTPEKAAVRILAGREMGVGPIASVIGIRVNAGRVSMDATLMAGCIERSNQYGFRIIEHTDQACVLHFFQYKEKVGVSAFSMEDAKKAGLASKDTWKGYPRNMLFARALSNGSRWFCAGIFGGSVFTHEELGIAIDEEGRAVENGNELCTREQRQELCRLVEAAGESMPGFMAKVGIRLLDELSQHEAAKEIKRLEKRLAKAGGNGAGAAPGLAAPTATSEERTAPAGQPLTAAQQMLADGIEESQKPSTPNQRDAILGLAQFLVPDETECRAMLVHALTKRSCKKLAELNHLQAAALIEGLQEKIREAKLQKEGVDCPFDPTPQLPGM